MTTMIDDVASKSSTAHRNAIKAEMKRRLDKKNAEDKEKAMALEAQKQRRENRRCQRERLRIAGV